MTNNYWNELGNYRPFFQSRNPGDFRNENAAGIREFVTAIPNASDK